jgi:hypothetical protein
MSAIIASSVAELVSAYPTAGGIYFVTKHVVPPEHVAIWGWVIGWANFLGQAAGVASLAYTIGQMVLAAASINSGVTEAGYQYSPWVSLFDDCYACADGIQDAYPYRASVTGGAGHLWDHMHSIDQEAASDHLVVRANQHLGYDWYLYCSSGLHSGQTKCNVRLHALHRWLRLGQQGLVFSSGIP